MRNLGKYKAVTALLAVVTIFTGVSVYASEVPRYATSTRPIKDLEKKDMEKFHGNATSTRPFSKEIGYKGQAIPALVGAISNISGTSFTLTTRGNSKTYTVDASGANIVKRSDVATSTPTTLSVADLTTGENIVVIGQVSTSTSSVVAKQIMVLPANFGQQANVPPTGAPKKQGFLQKIGGFFGRLFGR